MKPGRTPFRGPARSRPSIRLGLIAAAVVSFAAFAPLLGPVNDAAALGCGPASVSHAAVAVVVDFGDGSPAENCVAVPMSDAGTTRSTGIDALKTAGHALRIEGGFLCAIDGVPASGCATGSRFDGWYWRYFKGRAGQGWVYSSVGFGYRLALVNGCAAEGWVWSGSPDASIAPRGGVPSLNCPSLPSTTTTRPSATQPGSSSSGQTSSQGGAANGGATSRPTGNGAGGPHPGTAAGNGAGASPSAVNGGGAGGDPGPEAGDGSVPGGAIAGGPGASVSNPGGATASQVEGSADSRGSDASAGPDGAEREVGASRSLNGRGRHHDPVDTGGSGSAVGLVVALLLVAIVLGIAVRKGRSRRSV